ncbi:MAG: ADP-ribosylglycohydrolase family protein [Prevotellaceae bacterium]|jgi:ADP-ribosylglycohydrolase|nr:ADP-ribosylglycohydrolase family protein [Prevotellaceae bacterium]
MNLTEKIKSALFGVAVGDALGVPVEFCSREELRQNPVTEMEGGEDTTYRQPAGTWSDDTSLTFCLAESLTKGYDLNDLAFLFIQWLYADYWTSRNACFDIGNGTEKAIVNLVKGVQPELAGGDGEYDNGNGSLMRILPLVFYLRDKPIEVRFEITRQVSSITHRHIRSIVACFYYLEFARKLLEVKDKFHIYKDLQTEIPASLKNIVSEAEIGKFSRILQQNIYEVPEDEIQSGGYVLHTIEASLWCLLTTDSYEKCVLKAVNLGEDTDTTAAVAGGLAGLLYGFNNIPERWLKQIARREDILNLCKRLSNKYITLCYN